MAIKLADVFVNITGDDRELDQSFDRAKGKANAFGNVMQGVLQGVGQALFRSAVDGFHALVGAIDDSIDRASDLNESINKTGAVFGQSAQEVVDWSKTTSSALGQSQQQALEAASGFGNLLTSMGFARGEAAETSRGLVELASDLASFNNIDPTVALEKLRSGLVGETEPLRTLGVNLSAAAVEAKALELGLTEAGGAVSEQAKVTARLAIIYEQTANAQGDFARTADATANASRRVAAGFENLSTTFGAAFEPIKRVVLNTLADIIESVQPYAENIVAQIANGLAAGLRYITPVLQTMRSIFVYWLQPGSPPRLLPELIAWGQSAAGEYLKGWGQADFSALEKLGGTIENVLRSFVDTGQIKEIDVVGRIFGTRDAIARAVSEFRELGSVSQGALNDIARAAGPAGNEVAGVVQAYFQLEAAARATAQAQDELNSVNERFADIIDPLQGQLDTLRDRERAIRNQQQRERIQASLQDPLATPRERELLQLQLQQLNLQDQLADANRNRAAAVSEAEDNLSKAQENEAQAQDNLNVQQAILDQRVKENQLLGEQIRLQERLAAAAKAANEAQSAKALREAEAAARAAEREAQQLADAQLRYRLQVADTEGDIAILREELAKTTEGSAEYYDILTQITALEQQLANQRSKGSPFAALPEIPPLEIPNLDSSFGEELTSALKGLEDAAKSTFSIISGEGENVQPPALIVEFKKSIDNLIEGIGQMNQSFNESFNTDAFQSFVTEISEFLRFLNENWLSTDQSINDSNETSWQERGRVAARQTEEMLSIVQLFLNVLQGDWSEAWQNVKDIAQAEWDLTEEKQGSWLSNMLGNFGTFYDDFTGAVAKFLLDTGTAFNEWFLSTEESFNSWLTDTYDAIRDFDLAGAGRALLDSLWSGLREKWDSISTWFSGKLQGLSDLLPGSEPKDPSSPLRGLPARGEEIVNQLQRGIERASFSVQPFANAGLQTATASPAAGGDTFNIVINAGPNTDVAAIRSAAKDGVMAARRARGG